MLVVTVVVMDFCIYWQHRLFHMIPILWRFHKVHHADREVDVTTGVRFHPLEMLMSAFIKASIILMLGAPLWTVIIFETLLNVSALFTHANIRINTKCDRILRWLIVTPDMHRIHHSVIPVETNSNYGFFLSIWDRVFGSYTQDPDKGHRGMTIGLNEYQAQNTESLRWCITLPFLDKR